MKNPNPKNEPGSQSPQSPSPKGDRGNSSVIRILIVDDHAVLRDGLRFMIQNNPRFELAGEAENGEQAILLAAEVKPDVILMDLVMEPVDGIQAISQIKADNPEARILVLTSFADDDKVFPAIKAGALGYLLKDSTPEQLAEAIYGVHRGELSLHPRIAIKVIRELNHPSSQLPPTKHPLTGREVAVLKLVALGLSNGEIGEKLSISELTVSTHVRNILGKLQLANRTQAALYALREGLADLK
jgi:two-component system, NarL family, response regulator LiaR